MKLNNIVIDGLYSKNTDKFKLDKKIKDMQYERKPCKPSDIWEDYKQIYADFELNTPDMINQKVLFINSLDCDLNPKTESLKFDSQGYFLIDAKSKPAKPLVEGIPLSYDSTC